MSDDTKSNYVGVRLNNDEAQKLEEVMDALEPVTGRRNMSDAMRYIIRHFDLAMAPLGKEQSLARVPA